MNKIEFDSQPPKGAKKVEIGSLRR